jgi:hypothetical protein
LLLQIQLILQLLFQYWKVGKKKAWPIHDHWFLISTNFVVFSNKTLAMLVDMWKLSKSWHNNYH